jgi:hypothetical protein
MKKAGSKQKSCRRMRKMRGGMFESWIPSFWSSKKTPDAPVAGAPVAPVADAAVANAAGTTGANTMLGGKKCKSRKCKK